MTAVIVDTSAILAIFDESYAEHPGVARALAKAEDLLVVSPMVVAEADYMLASRLGPRAARRFAADIASEAYDLGRSRGRAGCHRRTGRRQRLPRHRRRIERDPRRPSPHHYDPHPGPAAFSPPAPTVGRQPFHLAPLRRLIRPSAGSASCGPRRRAARPGSDGRRLVARENAHRLPAPHVSAAADNPHMRGDRHSWTTFLGVHIEPYACGLVAKADHCE